MACAGIPYSAAENAFDVNSGKMKGRIDLVMLIRSITNHKFKGILNVYR